MRQDPPEVGKPVFKSLKANCNFVRFLWYLKNAAEIIQRGIQWPTLYIFLLKDFSSKLLYYLFHIDKVNIF